MLNQPYRIILTEDASYSLYSEEYLQTMHSVSGAYEEAVKKHVIPSKILELRRKEVNVLDIGFGLGYNVLALMHEFLRKDAKQQLGIISLEMDFSYIPLINEISFNDSRQSIYNSILDAIKNNGLEFDNYKIKIIKGDARDSIKRLDDSFFDAVFHDPYSPAKNPELWTVDFFREVNRVMRESAILTTYSSAVQIRRALLEAGFIVGKGPSVGKKREGTLASRMEQIAGLSEDETVELISNYKSVPYRDEFLNSPREEILNQRIERMREIRNRDSD